MISKTLANKYIKKQHELENILIAENKKLTDKVKVLEAEIGKVKKDVGKLEKDTKIKEKI